MKKFIKNLMTRAAIGASQARAKLNQNDGQFVMDNAVVFVVIIVIAGIALVLLTNYLQNDLSGTISDRINDFFN